jgi:hypothetical protein
MSNVADLEGRVRAGAEGTPYVVTSVEGGFDLTVDLADAQWWGLFNRAGLRRSIVHEVRLRDDETFTVTDVARSVDWVAGVPTAAVSASLSRGRLYSFGGQQVWALDDDGRISAVLDYSFDSSEGRQLVETAAQSLGLTQRRGVEERIAIGFAIVGGVGGLVTVVVLVVAALLGKL